MNEENFVDYLAKLFHRRSDVGIGPGDDAAVLDLGIPGTLLLAAADQVIENIHYLPETPIGKVARKLLNRNISDIAAMGGVPTHALVTLASNPLNMDMLKAFHEALGDEARKYNVSIIGGDIAANPVKGSVISLTILGTVLRKNLCLRSNACAGDLLYCTGEFGNSFPGDHHLEFVPRLRESQFLAGFFSSAMIDVSDGLLKDASRMAHASKLAVVFHDPASIPARNHATLQQAFCDGEDYELIFAVPPGKAEELERKAVEKQIKITRIGYFKKGKHGTAWDGNGNPIQFDDAEGYDHFHEK